MNIGYCKLCNYQDDTDYLHPVYDGKSTDYILICEKCRNKLFSDRELVKPEDGIMYSKCAIHERLCHIDDIERCSFLNPCKHEWGSENLSDSDNPTFDCDKCGAVVRF